MATLTQFTSLAKEFGDPDQSGAAVYSGVTARPADGGWVLEGTAHHVLDGDRADQLAVVTDAGAFVVPAAEVKAERTPVFDPVLHIAEVTFPQVRVSDSNRSTADPEHARHRALTGMALTVVGACRRALDLVLDHARLGVSHLMRRCLPRRAHAFWPNGGFKSRQKCPSRYSTRFWVPTTEMRAIFSAASVPGSAE